MQEHEPAITEYNPLMLDEASACFLDVFSSEPFCFGFLDIKKAERYLDDISKTPGFRGFRFDLMGVTAGFCYGVVMDYFAAPYYDIKEIFIARKLHGTGAGSAALGALEALLAKDGIRAVTLNTSRAIPAFRFYLKNGYTLSDANVHMSKLL